MDAEQEPAGPVGQIFAASRMRRGGRGRALALAAGLTLGGSLCADAQGLAPDASEAAASAALSVLGMAATPNETLSSFSFLNASGGGSDFQSTQFFGGVTPARNPALYLEGLIAYQIYNPVAVFPDIVPGSALDVTWTSIAGTAGLGYEIPLARGWTLRPMGHLSLGYVSADAFLSGLPIVPLSREASEAVEGGLRSGGVGASLGLFTETGIGRWEVEYRFRHSYMAFYPLSAARAGNAWADAHQTTFFNRNRLPLDGLRIGPAPLKGVLDAGVVLYHGDGARVLGSSWLGSLGAGIELDTEAAGAPVFSSARVMLSGVLGDGYSGFSVGLGLSF